MSRDITENLVPGTSQFDKEKNYWLKKFTGELVKSYFPYDFPGKDSSEFALGTIEFTIPGDLSAQLIHLTNRSDKNLFVVLAAALVVLLAKYTGNSDLVSGCPILKQDVEGEFKNAILALRTRLNPNMSFKELLLKVRQTFNEANENSNYPIERLLYYLGLPKIKDGSPLFGTVLLLQNIHHKKYIEKMNHNMRVRFRRTGQCIDGAWEYNAALYRKKTVERIISHLLNVLENSLKDLNIPVSHITVLSEKEQQQILVAFNDNRTSYRQDHLLNQLFEAQVKRTPGHWAVVAEDDHFCGMTALTYAQLNEKSNQLARFLRQEGVGRDTIVAIMVAPSLEMAIGIMAISKAGGAYLPIDHESPGDRIKYLLNESHCQILLTQHFLDGKIDFTGKKIAIDDVKLYSGENSNPEPVSCPNDLFYTIYTSGTTGKPKGGLLTNRNLVNYVSWFSKIAHLTDKDKTVLTSSFAFDLGYTTFLGALLTGGELHLVSKETYINAEMLLDYIKDKGIGYLKMTPSLFSVIVNSPGFSMESRSTLRLVLLGGEEINIRDVEIARQTCPHIEFINHYGPTETAIGSVARFIDFNCFEEYKEDPAIGKPIHNTMVFILDKNLRLLPVGTAGELFIGGDGVARGYLNRPELTAEKFNHDLQDYHDKNKKLLRGVQGGGFLEKSPPGRRRQAIYKTGDMARWLPDGNIRFLGRNDNQVKIRGFRIELGEIQAQMLKSKEVKDCVIIAKDDKGTGKYLCAYVVPQSPANSVDVQTLKNFLSAHLPDFMIPAYFIILNEIPLTPNGKVDRNALPAPEIQKMRNYIPPQNEIEKTLVNLWVNSLDIEEELVSVDANFFQLGGHSLSAAILISKIHQAFDVQVPLVKIFEKPTVRELAEYLKGADKELFTSIPAVEMKEYYALSSAQSRLYFLHQMEPTTTAYNITEIVELETALDRGRLEETFQRLSRRHESLRTSFEIIGDQAVQRVHPQVEFAIEYHDLAGKDQNISHLIEHFVRPFDLSRNPLIRVSLVKIESLRHVMIVDIHHIVSDGISHRILIKDFYSLNQAGELPGLRLQYKDYAEWQQSQVVKETLQLQEKYWLNEFPDQVPVLDLPLDFPRPALQSFEGSTLTFELNQEETKALNEIARSNGATLFMVLLTVQNIFLSKLSSREDIIVGTPIAGRRHADLEQIVGMFVNTLALRNYPSTGKTFTTLLQEVKTRTLQAFENQDYQFEDLVDQLELERNLSRNPLFDVEFILQNIRDETREILPVNEEQEEMNTRDQTYAHRTTQFDLALVGYEGDERLIFMFVYCTRLFKEDTILRFSQYFKHIIWSIIENPGEKIMEIAIITEEEKNRLLYDFNDTEAEYPKDKTIHELFADQVEKTPNRTASIGNCQCSIVNSQLSTEGEGHLSYKELDKRSGQLAWLLIEKGVKPGTIVGIMVDRSIEMIVGIFGIVKAGGAYLPLDHEYPEARIKYIVEKSGTNVVITRKNLIDKGKDVVFTGEIIDIFHERLSSEILDDQKDKGARKVYPPDPAYVIYTSGSTGNPKGVVIQHQNVANFITGMAAVIDFSPGKSILAVTTISFDIFFLETLLPLTRGLKVVIAGEDHQKDPALLEQLILKNRIDMVQFTPSRLQLLLNLRGNLQGLSGVEELMVGGEAFPSPLLEKVKEHFHGKIYNMYGPTETTIWSAVKELTHTLPGEITIGTPIANTRVYIVNRNNHPQPPGVNGELWIGGDGVASGYLNNVELTAEKFISSQFQIQNNPRHYRSYKSYKSYALYKTGDLARWLSNREIEFLGRLDLQVKIRGFRIELEEIEEQLLKHDGIKEAVVVMKSDPTGHNYLCAYMVPQPDDSSGPPDTPVLRENLSVKLPSYMIPAYFVYLEKMPLTPNGKIDRKALPSPEIKAGQDYIAPRTETEKKLLEIWAEILLIEKDVISIDSNFFRLGGQSLRATIMVNKIHKEFGVETSLADIFQTPTIERIATIINAVNWVENKKATTNQEREEIIL